MPRARRRRAAFSAGRRMVLLLVTASPLWSFASNGADRRQVSKGGRSPTTDRPASARRGYMPALRFELGLDEAADALGLGAGVGLDHGGDEGGDGVGHDPVRRESGRGGHAGLRAASAWLTRMAIHVSR